MISLLLDGCVWAARDHGRADAGAVSGGSVQGAAPHLGGVDRAAFADALVAARAGPRGLDVSVL
ncbi:hypothetical protein [Actinomadura napierensis]